MNTRAIGTAGENAAVVYLQKHGYKVLERNFACKLGEIDIIAQQGDYFVFVEVKSRNTLAYGRPCEAVTPNKQKRIISATQYWMFKRKKTGLPVRFDVVEVLENKVSVIVDAFRI